MTVPKSISENDNLLSTTQVAEKLGVHRSSVNIWIGEGRLLSEKHGNFHAVSLKALKKFMSFYSIEPTKKPKAKKAKAKTKKAPTKKRRKRKA